MNSRGQFWSLDVVLAAALFTLAIGLVLSQTELLLFYGQQDRLTRELVSAFFLGSNNLMSQRDLVVTYTPTFCDPLQYLDPGHISPSLCRNSDNSTCGGPSQPPCSQNVTDLSDFKVNLRCGPNMDYRVDALPTFDTPAAISSTIHGWLSDNELSGLENCLVDYNAPIRGTQISLSQSFNFDANYVVGTDPSNYFFPRPGASALLSMQRKIIAFPRMPSPSQLRDCLDGLCSNYVADLNFRVWRVD